MPFTVAGRKIGPDEPCFVIAEAGVNHDNRPDAAHALVDLALWAGCDAIKFQTYKAADLAAHDSPLYWDGPEASQRIAFDASDKLSPEAFARVLHHARERGIIGFSTPFSLPAVDYLERLDVPLYKIASADITYHQLLTRVALTGKPILLSTGASTLWEIEKALDAIGTVNVVLLACTLCYPTNDRDANLRQIRTLIEEFGCPVGLSDHTESTTLPAVAASLGACVVEKHFTSSRQTEGGAPDHRMSADPEMMARLVEGIRSTERALGHGRKEVLPCEVVPRLYARRSVAAAVDIAEGATIMSSMLTCLRPGDGLPPVSMETVVGCTARRPILEGSLIRQDDLR